MSAQGQDVNNNNKKVVFKDCALFIDFISEINNIHIDNAKDIDIVMPMYKLIKPSDNFTKIYLSLWRWIL